MHIVLMAIKPQYTQRIFAGEKRFEIRRVSGRIGRGDVVVVYASAPVRAIVGAFLVQGVRRGSVEALWEAHEGDFGVSAEEYRGYCAGAREVSAIEVGPRVTVNSLSLAQLRERYDGFRPPQSYLYWRHTLAELIGWEEACAVTGLAQMTE